MEMLGRTRRMPLYDKVSLHEIDIPLGLRTLAALAFDVGGRALFTRQSFYPVDFNTTDYESHAKTILYHQNWFE